MSGLQAIATAPNAGIRISNIEQQRKDLETWQVMALQKVTQWGAKRCLKERIAREEECCEFHRSAGQRRAVTLPTSTAQLVDTL